VTTVVAGEIMDLKTVRNPGGPVCTYVSRYLPACGAAASHHSSCNPLVSCTQLKYDMDYGLLLLYVSSITHEL